MTAAGSRIAPAMVLGAVAFLILLQTTAALMPPHPNFTEWESVHQMRRRLNITWNYEPIHLSHEHCRHLTEEECRLEDEGLGDAKLHRNGRHLSPSTGTMRILVLLIKFPEYDESIMGPLPTLDYFEDLFNGDGRSSSIPIGSLKEYFRYNSLGKYRVQFDIRGWFEAVSTEASYAMGNYGLLGQIEMQKMFYSAMDEVDRSDINWWDGYINEWGLINHMVVLHSGIPAEFGNRDCFKSKAPDRIWSQGSASSQTGYMTKDYYQVNGYALASAFDEPSCEGNKIVSVPPAGLGVIVHEYLHGFGLKDLYDQDTDDAQIPLGGTGRFDIMSNSIGWDRNSLIPGHMSPFSRMFTPGWLDPIVIERNGFYAIQPSEISGHIYKITHNFPEGEYLLIENRQPIKWDENWPEQTGIVIYHVDEKANNQGQRGYPGKAGWPADHYMVSVLQADGAYDIEKGNNVGDETDFWRAGDELGPGPNTWPNTDSIQGKQYQTNIKITIQSKPGFIMTFRVNGINGMSRANNQGDELPAPETMDETGEVLSWMLSLFGGVAAMLGVMIMVL